ncbi:hypothetical protein J437_LFUL013197 [Ladona fulva]|uniref:Uncharacterized protein n=1 Tax=Ladona fulva TaxID=123851 RepID=A0A8K0KGZ2_LADFU|nr:hypothetical protein J437_LFUL013197 [Ladona fulva]
MREQTVMILRQFLAAWAFLTGGAPANESLSSQSTVTRITETRSPTYYTTRFDYVNVDSFLSNSRLVNSYLACIMDKGPCTKEGNELKGHYGYLLFTLAARLT